MRIVDRYVARELLVPFLLGIAIFTSILLIARILKLVELVVNRGVSLLAVLELFSFILPAFLELTVPMALLLAILVAFGRLSSDSELIAMQASGLGIYRLATPVAVFSLFVLIVTMALSVYARPWANEHLRTGLYEILKARASAGIREKIFNDEFAGLVIYVDDIEPPGQSLHGVLISDTREPSMHNTVFARMGIVVNNEEAHTLTLRLLDGGIYTSSPQGRGFQDTRFSTYDISLDLNVTLGKLKRNRDVNEMSLFELRERIRRQSAAGQPSHIEKVEIHHRFAIPFACLVFAALGVPLGIRPSRSVHSWGLSMSIALIFVYYLLLSLGQNLGERGTLPAAVAMWLPNLLLSMLAAFLLARAGSGTPFSGPQRTGPWESALATRLAARFSRVPER